MPTCWIIAGPNGAGKTTFALKYLPKVAGCTNFINADLIAAGLSPLAPEREMMAKTLPLKQHWRGERTCERSDNSAMTDGSSN